MNSNLYTIEAISNLHVGSGDVNYGVVDNLIQRDAITGLPVINSSSLKGAFREHCKTTLPKGEAAITEIFGSDPKGSERTAGTYRFFDANLLAMPVRSNLSPFLMSTCPMILKEFLSKSKLFNIKISSQIENILNEIINLESTLQSPLVFCEDFQNAYIEDLEIQTKFRKVEGIKHIEALMGNAPLVLVCDSDFRSLCDDNHLPVIARNYLNDGKSENLFYEQVLPRLSRLYFILMHPDNNNNHETLNKTLKDTLMQIGANASVGYGYCKITPFNDLNK